MSVAISAVAMNSSHACGSAHAWDRASAVGINNENSLALANAKFDFTLLKIKAPAEYASLGSSLSVARREEAEDGPIYYSMNLLILD
jgi:hypothetical protein